MTMCLVMNWYTNGGLNKQSASEKNIRLRTAVAMEDIAAAL